MARVKFYFIEKIKYFSLVDLYVMGHDYLNGFKLKNLHSVTY
jgi:hypothetical protein